jgi:Neuraminidase (sialidase)
LQNGKSDIAVAKSTDFGATWNVVIADSTNAGTDKPVLLVRGKDVYVGYNHAQKVWVSSSHDAGATWQSVNINQNSHLGWSLAGGGAITPSGAVYFSWSGYTQNGGAKGPVNLYVSKSSDGGNTWTSTVLDVSGAPPDCSAFQCGWAYLGAAITMTSDPAGTLYALWNSGTVDKGAERIFYSTSTDGVQWSAKREVSTAPIGVAHAFPAVTSGGVSDIRIAWMDNRRSGMWNVFYRSSTDGGKTWTAEQTLSSYVPGFEYINQNGFSFPFGDYFEMDVDPSGITHAVWGEGLNYQGPGSIWYTTGK